jgi:hypothetical protein
MPRNAEVIRQRTFAVQRIKSLSLTPQTFDVPEGASLFDVGNHPRLPFQKSS